MEIVVSVRAVEGDVQNVDEVRRWQPSGVRIRHGDPFMASTTRHVEQVVPDRLVGCLQLQGPPGSRATREPVALPDRVLYVLIARIVLRSRGGGPYLRIADKFVIGNDHILRGGVQRVNRVAQRPARCPERELMLSARGVGCPQHRIVADDTLTNIRMPDRMFPSPVVVHRVAKKHQSLGCEVGTVPAIVKSGQTGQDVQTSRVNDRDLVINQLSVVYACIERLRTTFLDVETNVNVVNIKAQEQPLPDSRLIPDRGGARAAGSVKGQVHHSPVFHIRGSLVSGLEHFIYARIVHYWLGPAAIRSNNSRPIKHNGWDTIDVERIAPIEQNTLVDISPTRSCVNDNIEIA